VSFQGTLTTQYLNTQTTSGIYKTLYIQGKNTGKEGNYVKLIMIVCGSETVICNDATDYVELGL
jgi:hypothetical protein